MVDLKQKPFYLSDEDIRWVEETIASMTDEEKIGQLFIMLDRKKILMRRKRFLIVFISEDAVTAMSRQKRFMNRTVFIRNTAKFRF